MMTNPVSSTLAVTEVADRQDKKSDDASKSQAVKADVATSERPWPEKLSPSPVPSMSPPLFGSVSKKKV